ncbi:hypothetical protein BDZ97DRAFT_1801908 [Flammula alnicola]|nr:hypothetical protein BDZ97DRAFT_1801908 [Flammula alnicola]
MAPLARRRVVVNGLRIFWVLIILWYEYATFAWSVHACNWPDSTFKTSHVLLVADPQIIDRHSYPSRGRLASYLTRLIVDLNLRKNWRVALNKKPDIVVFLGDMMDNGRYDMSDADLGKASYFSPYARSRYTAHFGEPNREISVANHSLILFDAPSYADEDSQRHGQRKTVKQWVPRRGGALEFLNKFASEEHTDPVILFSHIPLYRSDGRSCGPLRESGAIRPGVGSGYQNVLEKQSSRRLLEAFQPVAVFSGDDHDYCEYTHQLSLPRSAPRNIQEITVKTISMVMNVRRPGFQLLSLAPADLRTEDNPTYADKPCLLPDQLRIYLDVYLPLLAISLLLVAASNLNDPRRSFHSKSLSDAVQVIFYSNIDEAEQGEAELSPYYTSPPHGLPSPVSAGHQNNLTSRASRSPGWFGLQGRRRQLELNHPSVFEWLERIKDIVCFCQPGRTWKTPRRRGWLGTTLRDIRDIAVFPLGVFALITWWVVTK